MADIWKSKGVRSLIVPNEWLERVGERGREVGLRVGERARTLVDRGVRRGADRTLAMVEERIGGAVDVLSSRLLATDAAASELALLVEAAVQTAGQEAIVRVVLRNNILLDGTLLGMIQPMLDGGSRPALDGPTLARAQATLARLCVECAELASGKTAPADASSREQLAWLATALPDQSTDTLVQRLGDMSGEGVGDFVLGGYMIFLQTYFARATLGLMKDLRVSARDRAQELEGADP